MEIRLVPDGGHVFVIHDPSWNALPIGVSVVLVKADAITVALVEL